VAGDVGIRLHLIRRYVWPAAPQLQIIAGGHRYSQPKIVRKSSSQTGCQEVRGDNNCNSSEIPYLKREKMDM
jgi:hypothetical protein